MLIELARIPITQGPIASTENVSHGYTFRPRPKSISEVVRILLNRFSCLSDYSAREAPIRRTRNQLHQLENVRCVDLCYSVVYVNMVLDVTHLSARG